MIAPGMARAQDGHPGGRQCEEIVGDAALVAACRDSRLREIDERITYRLTRLAAQLDDADLEALQGSQDAFATYRRRNCLWYLDLAAAGTVPDSVARRCLVRMSARRLNELASLLAPDGGLAPPKDDTAAPEPSIGTVDDAAADAGTGDAPSVSAAVPRSPPAERASGASSVLDADDALLAYFGDWRADCASEGTSARCRVSVALSDTAPALSATALPMSASGPELTIVLTDAGLDRVEYDLAGLADSDAGSLRWRVDGRDLGTWPDAVIRGEGTSRRQVIDDADVLADTLMPALKDGVRLVVDQVGAGVEGRGEASEATLMGLTRALAFADDFIDGRVR